MGNFSYITNRTLQNRMGEEKGRVSILVRTGSTTAEYKYTCPECGDARDGQQEFKRPIMIRCQKCGYLMKLPKLKDELKKEKKKLRDA
jgi:DNA-directed RNA polymerase subunit RPC12/RpoP